MSLPKTLVDRACAEFAPEEREGVVALLGTYGREPHHREMERVLGYCLDLARGDRAALEALLGYARQDYRDILFWAENADQARLDTPGKRDALNRMLERFGAGWRAPEG